MTTQATGASGASGPSVPAGVPPPPGRRDRVGLVLRGLGQLLVTLGLVVLLFVVYEVWVTGWQTHREQTRIHQVLEEQWQTGDDVLSLPEGELTKHEGEGLANLYVPRFGVDYQWSILQGVGLDALDKGPGHYPASQLPGEPGDFAVAGHRVGKGNPFLNLDQLQPGDAVIVETQSTWFVYCVLGTAAGANPCDPRAAGGDLERTDANGVPGREVVRASQGEVVLPVPSKPAATEPYQTHYMTMTTCTPKFTATHRMIVHAILDPQYPEGIAKTRSGDRYSMEIPARIKEFYTAVGD